MSSSVHFILSLSGIMLASILYVILGQVTVCRLRKNSETKHALGFEFAVSGADIIKVAQTLSLPKSIAQKIRKNSTTGLLNADPDILYKHTTVYERILARVFYWLLLISGLSLFLRVILRWFME